MNSNSLKADRIRIYGDTSEKICIIRIDDSADKEEPVDVVCDGCFVVRYPVDDWNTDLSPWEAPPVFGNKPFGNGAASLLALIESELLPYIDKSFGPKKHIPAGYSLAGLFSLYCICNSGSFAGAVAVSPSVWFPGWIKYASGCDIHAEYVYLSLGDKESKTKNAVMSSVEDNIRTMYDLLLEKGIDSCLEWNKGGHFNEPAARMQKGIDAAVQHYGKKGF